MRRSLPSRRSPVPCLLVTLVAVGAAAVPVGGARASDGAPIALIRAGSSAGSATLVAPGYWLTANHVTGRSQSVTVRTPSRGWSGRVVARDGAADLSLIETSPQGCPEPIRIWTGKLDSSIERSMDYYAEGYANASFSGHGRRKGRIGSLLGRMTRFLLPSIPGDSGGCVYTVYGQTPRRYLAGVVSGSNWPEYRSRNSDGYTVGASPEAIRAFLTSAGLTMDAAGRLRCPPRRQTLGGRHWPDPIQPDT